MSSTLSYTLSLKDLVTAKLQKIAVSSDMALEHFAGLEKKASSVSLGFKEMGVSVHTLQQKIDLLKRERDLLPTGSLQAIRTYNSEINKLTRNVNTLQTINGSRLKTWASGAVNSLPGLATNPLVMAGTMLYGTVKNGMEADMQKANLLTLTGGDQQKANALYGQVSDYAKATPYGKGDLIDAQKTMMSFGISGDKSFGVLKQLGDIALGDAQKMQSLALAFSQATSAGKLQGQDLLQMINAGFNPLNELSKRTGESMASLKKRMSEGKIGADELAQAFAYATDEQGLFYKGAEKAGQTLSGRFSTLLDSISELALSVYRVVEPVLMPVLNFAITIFDTIASGVNTFIDKIKAGEAVFVAVAAAVGILTAAMVAYATYTGIITMAQNLLTGAIWKTNLAFLANPVFWVIVGIVALIAIILYLVKIYDGWGAAWSSLVEFLKISWELFKNSFEATWLLVKNSFLDGLAVMTAAWYKFKGLWDKEGAQEGLNRLREESLARAQELAAVKKNGAELAGAAVKALSGVKLTRNSQTFGTIKAGLMDSLGMGGLNQTMSADLPGGQDLASGGNLATAAVNGGPGVININGVKFAETVNIHSGGGQSAGEKSEDWFHEMFLRTLQSGAAMAQ